MRGPQDNAETNQEEPVFDPALNRYSFKSAKYAAETKMYGVAMHAVAQANGIVGESMDELETKLKSLGIGTQEARRGLTMMAAAGMDLSKAPQLARLGQDLAVMKPDMTSSQVFNNLLYGIQSGQ